MVKKLLIDKELNKYYSKDVQVFNDPRKISPLTSELAWKILNLINKRPMYPSEIAKILKIHEQKVYYHIKQILGKLRRPSMPPRPAKGLPRPSTRPPSRRASGTHG